MSKRPVSVRHVRLPLLVKLLVLLLLVTMVPLIILGTVSIQRGTEAVTRTAEQGLQLIAETTCARLDQLFTHMQQLQTIVATREAVVAACASPADRRKDLLAAAEHSLTHVVAGDPGLALAYIADGRGICLVSTSSNMVGRDYKATREYMRQALAGQRVISDLAVGVTTGEPGVFFAGPVRNSQGSLVGVLVLKLKGRVIDRICRDAGGRMAQSFAMVVDANGVVISHPDPKRLYHSVGSLSPDVLKRINPKVQYGIDRIESAGLDEIAEVVQQGRPRGCLRFIGMDKLPKVAGYARMTQRPWTVGVVQLRAAFDQPMRDLAADQRWWIAGVGLATALGAGWISYSLLRPIRSLRAAALKAAKGDWSARADVLNNDELGDLAHTFNNMMPALQERTQIQEDLRLATEVQQRTQRQADDLRTAEERTRLILESAAEGIFGVDTEGTIDFVNSAACRLLGYAAEELLGQPSHQIIHYHRPDGSKYPMEECPMYAAYKQGRASRIDNEFLWRKDGAGLPVEYGATPIHKDGKIVGAVISFTDITVRKQGEQALAASERKIRQILESTVEGFWLIDNAAATLEVNDAMCRILGRAREEIIGRTIFEFTDEENTRIFKENVAKRARGESGSYEISLSRPDGSLVPCQFSATPLIDEHGVKTGSFALCSDISLRKQQEAEVLTAKKKAEEATEMKSMFLANMSHEIRTPMNAIIGLSHLALKTDLSVKQRDYVSKIHNAGTSLLTVINDILDFSKIEAGRLDIESVDFKLDEVIHSVATVTGQKAHDKGLEFLVESPREIPQNLIGDPLRLGQVLTNLINNAVKFTEHGEIRVKVELLEKTGEKAKLRFSVRDTGMGMSKEQAARLFQPFTQADMSTTRKHGGTGLGLTISRRLVELMGGQIWLESEPGVGSTFIFTVWLGLGSESGKIVPAQLETLNVLVVDDNAAARDILVDALKGVTTQVDAVSSGPEAISAVKEHDTAEPYDVVFMDWKMPQMDGLQATRRIKEDPKIHKQPAVVMVTAFGREEVREEAERLNIDGFLVKPVTKSMLVDTLVTLFAPTPERKVLVGGAGEEQNVKLHGVRILLAEDNEINQQVAVELLIGVGATVEVANHGGEAVEKLTAASGTPYDLVLMDMQMPVMDGYQATAKIRSDPRFKSLPIIAMTAHATVEERQRCLAAGMNDHVAKPIDPTALFETLSQYYHGDSSSSAPPAAKADPAGVPTVPAVEGLNTSEGLRRVAGNTKLYLNLLRQFIKGQGDAARQVRDSLDKGEVPVAERIAHTAKGVAGNIGATGVQAAAGDLEKAIRNRLPADQVESLRVNFAQILGGLIAALTPALGDEAVVQPAFPAPAADPQQIKTAVARMTKLLADSDAAAADYLGAEGAILRGLFSPEAFSSFEQNITSYAFDAALDELNRAVQGQGG